MERAMNLNHNQQLESEKLSKISQIYGGHRLGDPFFMLSFQSFSSQFSVPCVFYTAPPVSLFLL